MRNLIFIILLAGVILFWFTQDAVLSPPKTLSIANSTTRKVQILDRQLIPLTITYQNDWNLHDYISLHEIPDMLQQIIILAEDKRFFEHNGPDWQARSSATLQNIMALQVVRGASTITEQVVRMLNPRPRTFWSRWLEGFEARQLESKFSKAEIIEFYLNQVPYASNRRGVVQAARHYFDRDLETLSLKEMLALATLIRAPGRLDLYRNTKDIETPIQNLAKRLLKLNIISQIDYENILTASLQLNDSNIAVQATHFVNYIHRTQPVQTLHIAGRLVSTLDTNIQLAAQKILDQQVKNLPSVKHGAVLIVEQQTGEVLAWVNTGKPSVQQPGSQIDAITTPRQPGSTLKPFLYALALEHGWTAATLIDDAPLAEAVGTGLHSYNNYSRRYYGTLSLREALGNSLNIPAIRTIQFLGTEAFLHRLHQLGMSSLTAEADHYGDGLALGNGAVTLLELVQAYTVLANQGSFRALKVLRDQPASDSETILSSQISSIIADILSDPEARRLEFGNGLRLPVQTAIKTGTSSDYRDAWTVGFNYKYTVGVWLGNLDQQPMSQVSGASGPALTLRAIFAELNRYEDTQGLYLDPSLVKVNICRDTGQRAVDNCPSRVEWFVPGTEPKLKKPIQQIVQPLHLRQPTHNLNLAMDPRIPDEYEAFTLILSDTELEADLIEWLIDDEVVGISEIEVRQFSWLVTRGKHTAQVRILSYDSEDVQVTPKVPFYVK
ncbi:transglycosylase domain-containing protein [Candidatus Halobeggiatoa sp. HSG11]|nr:transglycosylase domain-containing protein [Candidatus Halobeggiatoa sp. HSG11]